MPFNGKSGKFNASIGAVEVGCGEKAIKIGGENVLPFYTFDAPIEKFTESRRNDHRPWSGE